MEETLVSPYELLGVSLQSTLPEIMKAYQAALKARRHEPARLAWALSTLRDPKTRLLHDLAAPDEGALRRELADVLSAATSGSIYATLDFSLIPTVRLALSDRHAYQSDWREDSRVAVVFEQPGLVDAGEDLLPLLEFPS